MDTKKILAGLFAVMMIAAAQGCKNKQESKTSPASAAASAEKQAPQAAAAKSGTEQPAQPTSLKPAETPAEPPKVSPEDYWKIMLERMELTKKNYEQMLKIYKQHEDDPEKAREEIRNVRRDNIQAMQKIYEKHGVTARDLYPSSGNAREVMMERQEYKESHPDIKEKYDALREELRTLREQLRKYLGPGPAGFRARKKQGAPMAPPQTQPSPERTQESGTPKTEVPENQME